MRVCPGCIEVGTLRWEREEPSPLRAVMTNSALRVCGLLALILHISEHCAARSIPGDAADLKAVAAAGAVVAEGALLELTNATLAAQLAAVASPEKVIMFTTTSAFLPPLLNMTRNWFMHVHKCGTPIHRPSVEWRTYSLSSHCDSAVRRFVSRPGRTSIATWAQCWSFLSLHTSAASLDRAQEPAVCCLRGITVAGWLTAGRVL